MNLDRLLSRAATIGLQEAPPSELDAELERYCEGTLPTEQIRALRARAERDPQLRSLLEAYQPPPAEWEERLADRVEALLREEPAALEASGAQHTSSAESQPPSQKRRGYVAPLRLAGWLAPLAMAAGLALLLRPGSLPSPYGEPAFATNYQLEVRAEARGYRSAGRQAVSEAKLQLGPGERPVFVVRPEQSGDAVKATAQVYLLRAGAPPELLPSRTEQDPSGAVRLSLADPVPLPQSGNLAVVLAAEGASPVEGPQLQGPNWRQWVVPFSRRRFDGE